MMKIDTTSAMTAKVVNAMLKKPSCLPTRSWFSLVISAPVSTSSRQITVLCQRDLSLPLRDAGLRNDRHAVELAVRCATDLRLRRA